MKILDNIKSNTVSFFTSQIKILINIKSKMELRIRSRWDKLGKYGQLTFLALLSCLSIVFSYYFIFPSIVLFLIKKATWELIFLFALLLIAAAKIISFTIRLLYILSKKSRDFIRANIEFVEIFYINTTKPFVDKDTSEHSFRVVDAILKYFGVIATLAAVIGFATSYISSQETAKTERDKMLNELFYKAIEQIGSSDANVNLAGIYSLEQSAINFPKNQWKIVGLLANYIKQHPSKLDEEKLLQSLISKPKHKKYSDKLADKKTRKNLLYEGEHSGESMDAYKKKDQRVQAALGVICRRKLENDKDLFESIDDKLNEIKTDMNSYPDTSLNRIIPLATDRNKSILSDLSGYDMSGCNFHRVDLNRATIHNANMNNIYLSQSYLNEASLISSELKNADLEESQLSEANLTRTYFNNSILIDANLTKANLQESTLTSAKLINATMVETSLVGSYLKKADLTRANLTKSNLTTANLTEANLSDVNLAQASLDMANLTESNLTGSQNLNKDQIKQACYWKDAIYSSQQRQDLEIDKEESPEHQQKCKDKWEKKK